MSVISTIYNQGTGLINPIGEGAGLPIIVDDLVVNGNLTVLGTTQLIGDTAHDSNVTVALTTTTEDLVVNNNSILSSGVGSSNTALFLLPPTPGLNNQVLTVTDETTTPIETQWQEPVVFDDYVKYDLLTGKLQNNVMAVVTPIDNITVDNSIGLTGQRFKLPSNTITATNNQVLAILNSAVNPKTTSWVPQSIFNITSNAIDNASTGTNILSNVVQNIVNTPVLQIGIYIINYELLQFTVTTSRNFTYQSVAISTASANINNVIAGLRVGSCIPYASTIPATLFNVPCFTGCGVVNIISPTTLYLISLNIFTGASFTAVGTLRYTKIS